MKIKIKYTAKILMAIIGLLNLAYGLDMDLDKKTFDMLTQGRDLYARSVENEKLIGPAEKIFDKIKEDSKDLKGRALVYLGALEAVKGKHAFWPTSKMSHVNKAFEMMDSGVAENSSDMESLFVQATIYYNLPFFLSRKDEAGKNFKQIINLLPMNRDQYDSQFINSMIKYMLEEVELKPEARISLKKIEIDFITALQENR